MIRSRMVYLVTTVLVLILLLFASAARSQERPELTPLENWKSEGRMVRIYKEDKGILIPELSSLKMYEFNKICGKTRYGYNFVQIEIVLIRDMCSLLSRTFTSPVAFAIPLAFDVKSGDEINILMRSGVYGERKPLYLVTPTGYTGKSGSDIHLHGFTVRTNQDVIIDTEAKSRGGLESGFTDKECDAIFIAGPSDYRMNPIDYIDIYMKVINPKEERLKVKLVLMTTQGMGHYGIMDGAKIIATYGIYRPPSEYDQAWNDVWENRSDKWKASYDYVWNMIATYTKFHNLIDDYESKARMKEVQERAEMIRRQTELINRDDDSVDRDGTPMVLIPAGEFQMGSDDGDSDKKPVHTVYLDAFYMDVYEVTNAQYKKFMDATGREAPGYWDNPRFKDPKQPVMGVSWYDAKAYADWAGKRLPTEAEWEKAARGGLVGKKYPWGNGIGPNAANYRGVSRDSRDVWEYTAPVGKFPPNNYGLYDMAGNVWEWCADWYDKNYYSNSRRRNPTGPDSGSWRVLRGGSRITSDSSLRVAYRNNGVPTYADSSVGFRCVE